MGRGNLTDCPQAKHVSSKHLEMQLISNDEDSILATARTKFDVTFVNNKLLKKDSAAILRDGSVVNFCQNFFAFTVLCTTNSVVSNCRVDVPLKRRRSSDNAVDPLTSCTKLTARQSAESSASQGWEELQCEIDDITLMAIADVESAVYNRSHTAFANTKSLARGLLCSFQCDICLEVIAGCRSCIPCGHNFCALCITRYMDSKRRLVIFLLYIA